MSVSLFDGGPVFQCNSSDTVTPYIVGGAEACPHEFPYQVHLQYNETYVCGGTILNTFLILTAAHCLFTEKGGDLPVASRFEIVAGDHDLDLEEGTEQYRTVKYIILHREYNMPFKFANDIAILVLEKSLTFNSHINNISLAKDYGLNLESYEDTVIVTGWGLTYRRNAEYQGPNSAVLNKLALPILQHSQCRELYRDKTKTKITFGMFCAGGYRRGSCSGDSGGPATCRSKTTNETVLCGIVSFGVACGYKRFPAVYTHVAYHHDWIEWNIAHFGNSLAIPAKCKTKEFFCIENESCIDRNLVCDGKEDCLGGQDELLCLETKPSVLNDTFRCNSGRFISPNYVCDKEDDCGDNSDEGKCALPASTKCKPNKFRCKSDERCIDEKWRCDKVQDCNDNSDEILAVCDYKPKSCFDVQTVMNYTVSRVYTIYPISSIITGTEVYCDLETEGGGWTVFQSRSDKGPTRVDFYRDWADYEKGFGTPGNEHWMGLQNLAAMTSSGNQELLIKLGDSDNEFREAKYSEFRVANGSDKYRLRIRNYTGTAGDSLGSHNGMAFTTRDQDNDRHDSLNCAEFLRGAWWYYSCARSNLNGDSNRNGTDDGIVWYHWRGYSYSLKTVEMKIRTRGVF